MIDASVFHVLEQVDRAQVADRGFGVAGVERDLGAEVGTVHHAGVLLRAAYVAGILEGDPGVAGLEQHREHLAPHVGGGQFTVGLDLAACGLFFVGHVSLLEVGTKAVVQIGHVVG
ncbi:hypothetical protein FQZ97_1109020 [compost metagenome]